LRHVDAYVLIIGIIRRSWIRHFHKEVIMRLILSTAALGLLLQQLAAAVGTSAAATAVPANIRTVGRKHASARPGPGPAQQRRRQLIETEGEYEEDQEIRQEDPGELEDFEPEAPINSSPTSNATQQPEEEPDEDPTELVPEEAPEDMEDTNMEDMPDMADTKEEGASPPLPADLTTCEACLGPEAQGAIYAWFPRAGPDGEGICLSGCGVKKDEPCFTGAVYTDENCGAIAAAMERLDEATAAPTDTDEEETMTMAPTATSSTVAPTMAEEEVMTGTPTTVALTTVAPTAVAPTAVATGAPTAADTPAATTGSPVTTILPEPEEEVAEPTAAPVVAAGGSTAAPTAAPAVDVPPGVLTGAPNVAPAAAAANSTAEPTANATEVVEENTPAPSPPKVDTTDAPSGTATMDPTSGAGVRGAVTGLVGAAAAAYLFLA
jgi:hypothetical protein